MHPFRNLSIRTKVGLMGAILVASYLILGASFTYSLNTLEEAHSLLDTAQRALRTASELTNSALLMDSSLRDYVATGDPAFRASYGDARNNVDTHLQGLHDTVRDPHLRAPVATGVTKQIAAIEATLSDWDAAVGGPFLNARIPRLGLRDFDRVSVPRLLRLQGTVDQFKKAQQSFSDQNWVTKSQAATNALDIAFFGTGLTLLLVMLGFLTLSGSIVGPLLNLTQLSQAIAAGDYSRRVPVPGRNEIGRLAAAFNVMVGNLEGARGEQSATRARLEALNQLAAYVARSLHARDRAEAVVLTLQREFGADAVQVLIPEGQLGWVSVECRAAGLVEYYLFSALPDSYQGIVTARRAAQKSVNAGDAIMWTCPLLRADRLSGILKITFPTDQFTAAEPLLSSISRFCTNAFELSRVYELVNADRHRLDAILSSTGEGILVRDQEGRVALANRAVLRVLELGDRSVDGQRLDQVLDDPRWSELLEFIDAPHPEAAGFAQSETLPCGDRFITATRAPIQEHGMVGTVVVLRDVTQQVEVDRMKSEFVSIVSHELRTPLTSIKGSLGLLLGGAAGQLPEKTVQLLRIAQNNSDRLIRLINDILDISKIEAGRVMMARDRVEMGDVIRTAIEGVEPMAHAARARIDRELPAESMEVAGDRDRLLQVVTNLLSNAIKFSPADSSVMIRARSGDATIDVEVIDHGPGIPAEHQTRLFQKFYQVDSSSARAKSGTGLGLAISHAIVREHGGSIGVHSSVGHGSRFWFTLPRFLPRTAAVPAVEHPRVLVCDDDPDLAGQIARLLEQRGYTCETAHSGEEVLARARAQPFDLVTLDLVMPGLDGLEVARRLQQDPETRDLPVVFVSGSDEDREASGLRVAGWVPKPIDEEVLASAIRRAMRIGGSGPNGGAGEPLILLVDDDPDVLQVVGTMIESAGMRVSYAQGGGEALTRIRTEEPDAIVLDLMMPELDGFEVVKALRDGPSTRHIPILVLTAKDLNDEERNRLDLGDTRFLTKSYASQEAILDDLSQLLHAENQP